jgi:chromosome segregation ATPase
MTRVRDGIIKGAEQTVFDLAMEDKYQRAAMRAMSQGMEYLTHQFSAFVKSTETEGHKGDTADAGFWEPPRFEEAVCCMPGMPCWTGDFASAAGRAKIVADIAAL